MVLNFLEEIDLVWYENVEFWSRLIPKNLIDWTFSILEFPTRISYNIIMEVQYENIMYLVLETFKFILLKINRLLTPLGSMLMWVVNKSVMSLKSFGMQVERVLSSAKTINLRKLDDWVKSLINNQKSNGPRLKTWGTPIENRGLIEVHRVTKY